MYWSYEKKSAILTLVEKYSESTESIQPVLRLRLVTHVSNVYFWSVQSRYLIKWGEVPVST